MTALQSVKDLQAAYESMLKAVNLDGHRMKTVGQLASTRVGLVSIVYQRFKEVASLPEKSLEWRQTECQIQTNLSKLQDILTSDELIVGEGIVRQAKQLSRQIANLRLICLIPRENHFSINGLTQLVDELLQEPEGIELLERHLSESGKTAKREVPLLIQETIALCRSLKPSPEQESGTLYHRMLRDNATFLPILYAYLLVNGKDPRTCVECFSSLSEDLHTDMRAVQSSLSKVSYKEALYKITASFTKAAGSLIVSATTHLEGVQEHVLTYSKPSVDLISLLAKGYVRSNPERALYIASSICTLHPISHRQLVCELYLLIAQGVKSELKSCLFDHVAIPLELRLTAAVSLIMQSDTCPELQDLSLVRVLFDFIQMNALEKVQPLLHTIWKVAISDQASDWTLELLALALQEMCSQEKQAAELSAYIKPLFSRAAGRAGKFVNLFKANRDLYEWGLCSLAFTIITEIGNSKVGDTQFHELYAKIENANSRKKLLHRIAITLMSLKDYEACITICTDIAAKLSEDEASEVFFTLCLLLSTWNMVQAFALTDKIPDFTTRCHAREILGQFTKMAIERAARQEPLQRPLLPAITSVPLVQGLPSNS